MKHWFSGNLYPLSIQIPTKRSGPLVEKLLHEKIEAEQKNLVTTKPLKEEIPVPMAAKEENQKKGFFQKLFGQK